MKLAKRQTTIAKPVTLTGVGVHRGERASITLLPADPNTGVVFSSSVSGTEIETVARFDRVVSTAMSTVIGGEAGSVATIEHLMATLGGLGIDNAIVEVDGGEVPILDGSSAAFVEAIEAVGVTRQSVRRRYIKILKPVMVGHDNAWGQLLPHDRQAFDVEISFAHEAIGTQRIAFDLTPSYFRNELARARTFGFMSDVEGLWANGFALGASLDNTVAIGDDGVVNAEGLRFVDEFVRHKALDAVGDLALAGAPILGLYRSYCGGHRLNVAMLEALFAAPDCWTTVDAPVVREVGYAEAPAAPMPALAADVS